jgi:hypothetical protein
MSLTFTNTPYSFAHPSGGDVSNGVFNIINGGIALVRLVSQRSNSKGTRRVSHSIKIRQSCRNQVLFVIKSVPLELMLGKILEVQVDLPDPPRGVARCNDQRKVFRPEENAHPSSWKRRMSPTQ